MAKQPRVLVIEDSPTQAARLRSLLEVEGIETVSASSAEAGLDVLETARPDAILLDYHLPGMRGDAFCRAVKQNVATRAVPILMLTVDRSDTAQMRGLESGADDYLPKSADPDILLMRVRNLLRQRSTGPGEIADLNTRFSRARVLAIDDSPTYLHILEQELRAERYEVEHASSGEEGLEKLAKHPFDCVLVDFEMPGMNGAEVCRHITEQRGRGSAVVVVMLTSHDDKEHLTLALEAGADDYITKSADIEVIKARVRALLRRKFFLEENRRILEELRERDLAAERARAEKTAAELRATMADQLASANRDLGEANRKLGEALEITRAITENAAEALLMVDARGLVSFVNPAAEAMFGYSKDELRGQTLNGKLLSTASSDREESEANKALARCLATAVTIKGVDGVFQAKNGSRVDVSCSYAPILRDGKVEAAVLVLHDISERKRAEERLRESQKLESIGLLAGGIAHDFNNILTGIIGNASLAKELLPPGSNILGVLDNVVSAGERAADLTRQMLAYSGKGRFLLEPVNLSNLTREMTELLRASIPKNVPLDLELQDALPPIEADPGQMQQVIMNLVVNAAEAIGEQQGSVQIRTGLQWVDDDFRIAALNRAEIATGFYVVLRVCDSGCGMDEATRERIFDPFFSTKFAGRGLGLAAVAGIVRGHNGAIKLTTAPRQGSTFEVLFPAMQDAIPPPLRARAPEDSEATSHLILIIDDEDVVRSIASSALSFHGYRVRQASGGRDGIELLKDERGKVSLVLLDLTMPDLSGQETLHELRKIAPDLPVLVSSGYGEEQTMSLFSGQQVSGFLQKPYSTSRLLDKVANALGAGRQSPVS